MSPRPPSPEPPQASVAFFSERRTDAELFASICGLLLDRRAVPSGALTAPAERAFAFERAADLADALTPWDPDRGGAEAGLRRLLAGEDPAVRVMQAWFAVRPVGTLLAAYEPAASPGGRHPVAVIASAASLSRPGGGAGRNARAVADWLQELLRAGCERLDPLYAAIVVEGSLPPPLGLSADRRLGTELFVSDRLLAADQRLRADLADLFEEGAVESWPGGTFFSGWGWFNPAGRSIRKARTVEQRAAERLARAVRRAGPSIPA